jgi:lactoylglutathione lyase
MGAPANVKQAVPFFSVMDMERSLRFYLDGLGFTMTNKWIVDGAVRWCWLEHGEAAIMLQTFMLEGPHKNVPATAVGLGVTICFICEDALALHRDFIARGIAATKPFVGNAMWVTDVTDPDGYKLYFESKTDAPEESEYSG